MCIRDSLLTDQEKLQALQRRAQFRGYALDDDVAHFLLVRVKRNMRSLMEALEQIELETLIHQRKVTIPLVKKTLGL